MIFANPQAWHLLWLLPLIALGLHLFYKYRCKMMARFAQEHLIQEIAQGFNLKTYRVKALCIMAAFLFMAAALSRPQWGYHDRPVKRHGLDIMVAIDVSKSMLTRDVAPSRLERTKLAVKDLVMKLNGSDHIGLIAFAGDAMVMCPLTYDYNGFLLSLDDLGVDSIPRGGTDISQAIEESVNAYKDLPDSDRAVVLVTDGEDEEGEAVNAARHAKEKGIRIFTVGVGTMEGDLIQVTNADGQTEFLKDADGNVVKSRLNENLLQQIAYITGGAYIRSGGTQFGLDYLYDRQLSKLKKHDTQTKMARLYDERFQWPLTIAFVFLLAEALSPFWRRLGRRSAVFIIFFIFMPSIGHASVAGEVNKGNDLYNQGKFNDSLGLYQKALDQDGSSPVVKYDLGTALYKKGDYAKALGYLEQAAREKNVKIKPKAEYNLGNVLYKSAVQKENTNVDEAIKTLQKALGQYVRTVADDPKDQDALFNQDIVKKEIQRLKEKKKQQKQNQQKQQNKNQQQQDQKDQQGQQNQQDKQNQQNQQDQQKQQEQQKQDQQNQQDQQKQDQQKQQDKQQADQQQKQAQQNQKDFDRKQADDLLEEYQDNEEPKKLLNYMPKKIDERPVLKDW